jgi:hypothetical protein
VLGETPARWATSFWVISGIAQAGVFCNS